MTLQDGGRVELPENIALCIEYPDREGHNNSISSSADIITARTAADSE